MTQKSFPVVGKDYTNDQFAVPGSAVGSGILDQGGKPYSLTLSDTDNTGTIGVSSVDGFGRAVVNGFAHLMDAPVPLSIPAVSSTTAYHLGLRYDPTKASAVAGPISLVVIAGTVAMPNDGSEFLELFTVTRTASTVLSASQVVAFGTSIAPGLSVATQAAVLAIDVSTLLLGTRMYARDVNTTYLLREAGWRALGGSGRTIYIQTPKGQSGGANDATLRFLHSSEPFTTLTEETSDVTFECLAGGTANWAATFVIFLNGIEILRRQFRNKGDGSGYREISMRVPTILRAGTNTLTVSLLVNSSSSGALVTDDPQFRVLAA